jgi:hypothetical protein
LSNEPSTNNQHAFRFRYDGIDDGNGCDRHHSTTRARDGRPGDGGECGRGRSSLPFAERIER